MKHTLLAALASTTLLSACAAAPTGLETASAPAANPAAIPAEDPLMEGFIDPPNSARPRTWWHWMNGNVTQEGIAADLAWMDRVGLGGIQTFDANLATPQIVEERLVYMTPEWREAFRFAAGEAARLDLEMAIAASPGWSETGGPWVPAEDGVKKIAWGETRLVGGQRFSGPIKRAPTTTGPYQAIHAEADMPGQTEEETFVPPEASGHIAVLAVPVNDSVLPRPAFTLADGAAMNAAALLDDDLSSGISLPLAPDLAGALYLTYPEEVTVRTLDLSLPGLVRPFRSPPIVPVLEVRTGSGWQELGTLPLTNSPMTLAFEPVTGREFRLRISENPDIIPPTEMDGVEGAVPIDFFAPGDMSAIAVNHFVLSNAHRIDRATEKAGFAGVYDYYEIMSDDLSPAALGLGDVIDISDHVDAQGNLDWTPPAGSDWLVLDFGWSLIGTTNHPAPLEATGLEVDKYDPQAVRRYMETYLGMYRQTLGDDLIGERGLRALLTDSIETGFANWTPAMEREFEERRGYALRPWLPALTGMVIGSEAETERFLYDWRDTLAELLTDYHYGTVADVAHENGLIVYGEALEDKRPMLGDDLSMRRYADVPMAALWTYPRDGQVRTTLIGDMRGAASTAHVYGQDFVAAESMTAANSPWAFSPRDLRHYIDLEFAHGINRPVIHTSVHQPSDELKPGLSLAIFGQYFNRHETWAEMAAPWVTYMSRTAYLLQQGTYFADIALFKGEEAPVTAQFATAIPTGLPASYAYDFVNADMLSDVLRVEADGMISTNGGTRYRALVLGSDTANMTLPTLRRIAGMARQGATVIGLRPERTPSLADDAAEFASLVDAVWAMPNVIDSANGETALAGLGLGPDFAFGGGAPDSEILFLHRKLDGGGHLYFLTNRNARGEAIEARFRVTGFAPEWWDAVSGTARPLSYSVEGVHTVIALDLDADQSGFVVFRQPSAELSVQHPQRALREIAAVDGAWDVSFSGGTVAPEAMTLASLRSLSTHEDEDVRYFSGISTYRKTIDLAGVPAGERLFIDLGEVADLAEVWINGTYAGTSWFAPDRVDVTGRLREGENEIEVRVANRWINRLIGDQQPGAEPTTFTPLPTYNPDAPLRPSGLIGPVRLMAGD